MKIHDFFSDISSEWIDDLIDQELSGDEFLEAIAEAREHIAGGDYRYQRRRS